MLLSEDCPLSFTGMKQISKKEEITINGPVYTLRDVMSSMRANPLQGPLEGVGSVNCDFFGPKKRRDFQGPKNGFAPI
jgi:hypothetical protein